MISLTDLAMNFGNKSLFENASITFDPGKCYGIVGANGTGKSTLLRLISGDEQPLSGTISVLGWEFVQLRLRLITGNLS